MNLFWLQNRGILMPILLSIKASGVSALSRPISLFPLQRGLISNLFRNIFWLARLRVTIASIAIAYHLRSRIRCLDP